MLHGGSRINGGEAGGFRAHGSSKIANVTRKQLKHSRKWNYPVWLCVILAAFPWSLSKSQVKQTPGADSSFNERLEAGIALARKGDLKGAEGAFAQAVMVRPQDPRALTALGQVQEQLGKVTESIETFQRVVGIDPLSSEAHVNLGIALGDHTELGTALEESVTAIRLSPGLADAHFLRGRLLNDLGKHEDARSEFRKVLEINPEYAEALEYLAALDGDEGNRVEQANSLRRYLKLRPKQATAWFQLGQILIDESRKSEAIAAWRRAVTINPEYSAAIYSLGRALKETDPAESKRILDRFREIEEDQQAIDRVNMLGNQANLKMYDANYKGAIEDLKNAIVICGSCKLLGALEKNLGLAYCHAGQLDSGERELKIAESLIPEDPSVIAALQTVNQQRVQALDGR
jgi:tetratricopeptide (TPR) repeat protein